MPKFGMGTTNKIIQSWSFPLYAKFLSYTQRKYQNKLRLFYFATSYFKYFEFAPLLTLPTQYYKTYEFQAVRERIFTKFSNRKSLLR